MLTMADEGNRAQRPPSTATIRDAVEELGSLLQAFERSREPDIALMVRFARARLSGILDRISAEEFDLVYGWSVFADLRELLRNGFQGELLMFLDPLPEEAAWVADLKEAMGRLPAGSAAARKAFVLAMLYHHPYQVRGVLGLFEPPGPFMEALVDYSRRVPKMFRERGEPERFLSYLEDFCARLLDLTRRPQYRLAAMELAFRFCDGVGLGSVYSIDRSTRRFQEAKAQLLEPLTEETYGTRLDVAFPPADTSRPRIRIGVLWHDGDARTETFVGLAHLRGLNRSLFEVHSIVFSTTFNRVVSETSLMDDIVAHSDVVTRLDGQTMRTMVEGIRAADLDLLFVVNNISWGWDDYIALAMHRLARVQIVNYCCVTTTGFRNIDVWLSAEDSEPAEGADENYREALVRMPGSVLCFDRLEFPVVVDEPFRRADAGIPENALLFVSGANFYKLTPTLTETWADILARRPDAHLVLYPMNPNWDSRYPLSALRARLTRQLEERGVATDRIHIVGPWQGRESVFALLADCDVYLDSFPHTGGISISDALLLGVPCVTLRGRFQHAIQGANALEALGLAGWVAETRDDYVGKALLLAADPDLRARLHLAMLERLPSSSLLDVDAFGIKLSDTLCDIYRRFVVDSGADGIGAPVGALQTSEVI